MRTLQKCYYSRVNITHYKYKIYAVVYFYAFQESVRKAADLTLKTLSKVKLFIMSGLHVHSVCENIYMTKCLSPETVSMSRCVLECVSLRAPQPRELWQHCCRRCWKKELLVTSQRFAHLGKVCICGLVLTFCPSLFLTFFATDAVFVF